MNNKKIERQLKLLQLTKAHILNLQRGENKKHSEVDLDNQIRELVSKHLTHQTDEFLL